MPNNSIQLALYDQMTGWVWTSRISPERLFLKAMRAHAMNQEGWKDIRGVLAYVASQAADRKPADRTRMVGLNKQLESLVPAYAGTTKVWEEWKNIDVDFHGGGCFIVTLMRGPIEEDRYLSPLALPSSKFNHLSKQMIARVVEQSALRAHG